MCVCGVCRYDRRVCVWVNGYTCVCVCTVKPYNEYVYSTIPQCGGVGIQLIINYCIFYLCISCCIGVFHLFLFPCSCQMSTPPYPSLLLLYSTLNHVTSHLTLF